MIKSKFSLSICCGYDLISGGLRNRLWNVIRLEKHAHSNLEVLEARLGFPVKRGWKMQRQYHIPYLVMWRCLKTHGKPAWDLSSCKQPGTAALLATCQDVLFRASLWATSLMSLLSTQLVFLTCSHLSQRQLQPRITVVLTGLDSKDNTQQN